MQEDYCECEIYFTSFNDVINHFTKQYAKFWKTKSKDIKNNKNKYDKFESLYSSLKQMLVSLPDKGKNYISLMKNCKSDHKSQIEEIISKLFNLEILSQSIDEYHQKLTDEIPEELEELSEEEDQKEDEKKKKKEEEENEEEENEEELFANVDIKKTMKDDKENIIIIQNLLQSAELKAEKDEQKRLILKLQSQLDDYLNKIITEIFRNDEQIDDIERKVIKSKRLVVNGNDRELEKSAQIAINRRRLHYQGGFALALGAIGSVVPGIGNVIGAALGGIIGYGFYRADMNRLNKVQKKKEKMRKEIDNK